MWRNIAAAAQAGDDAGVRAGGHTVNCTDVEVGDYGHRPLAAGSPGRPFAPRRCDPQILPGEAWLLSQ